MKLAIKVDVDTYAGTRDGVEVLRRIFLKHSVPALFLFSFGPDNTGKSLRRIFRPGFLKKCLRSNVAGNYGLKTLLYGTLLPAPRIASLCAGQMRAARDDGFECGIHSWDHFEWQERVLHMRPTEVEREFTRARVEFEKVFGGEPDCFGAPGWQISPDALALEDSVPLLFASDTRGKYPFLPRMGERAFKTLQIPSTLMTLDELLGSLPLEGVENRHISDMQSAADGFSVMTVHAELEGGAYSKWFDSFLARLKSMGTEFVSMRDKARELLKSPDKIPVCDVKMLPFEGRSGTLAVQSI